MNAKDYRIDLHQIPELGRSELETKKYILNVLRSLNCEIFEIGKTGVVAYFNRGLNYSICFRADMDGLKIKEENSISFCSKHEGYSHACGHDGHMAMLLEYSVWASDNLDKLNANVVCLFQPSEEDKAGATDIINSKILDKLNVKEIYAFHIWPKLETNRLYTMSGGMLASSGEVNIEIFGKTVHAANRNQGVDALLIATKFVQMVYESVKNIPNSLFSFGILNTGKVRNAVSDYAYLEATMRAFDDCTFNQIKGILFNIKSDLEELNGCKINIAINDAYKSVINSQELIDKYKDDLDLQILQKPFLQAEDFGCYTRKYKALFMLLGSKESSNLHTSTFDFDMNILSTGVAAYKLISCKR